MTFESLMHKHGQVFVALKSIKPHFMTTIYFDKQVFSYLFSAKDEKYIRLREKIASHKEDFIFCYSNAHLFDLQDDRTDIKFKEMEFMQSIVDGNRLIYEDGRISLYNHKPNEVFNNVVTIGDLSWLDSIDFSLFSKEDINVINNITDLFQKDNTNELDFDWLVTRIPVSDNKLQIDKEGFKSLVSFVSYNFYNNKNSYKTLRDKVISSYNPKGITADTVDVFNEQFAQSPLGISFIELIKNTLTQVGFQSHEPAIVHCLSYVLLDMFGVNKEPRKKVKFRNVQIDSYHSFFGSYCDCLVSDDEGVRTKSNILYKLFNHDTQVLSIDEFILKLDEAIANNKKSTRVYFDEISNDYHTRKILSTEYQSEYTTTVLKTFHSYFGYFNGMFETKSNNTTIVILHKNTDIHVPLSVKEITIIVNRIANAFNSIGASWPPFNPDVEWPLLQSDSWSRTLVLDDAVLVLSKFKDIPMLEFLIKLKER